MPSEIQLSYRSTRPEETNDEIVTDGIVLPAMRFNREHSITGCLWVGTQLFYQVLEGRPEDVDVLYASIVRDPRHSNVKLLSREHNAQREFGRFSMKLVAATDEDQISGLLAKLPLDSSAVDKPLMEAKPRTTTLQAWSWQPAIVREIVSHFIRRPNRMGS